LHADLSSLAPYAINDMCVDRHGHAFVGQFGYDLGGGAPPATAALLLVDPDGSASVTCQPTPPGEIRLSRCDEDRHEMPGFSDNSSACHRMVSIFAAKPTSDANSPVYRPVSFVGL
jgi:hypothetical protein